MPETSAGPPVARLDRRADTPLWRQLAQDLRLRLDRADFARGLPVERARMTDPSQLRVVTDVREPGTVA